MPRLNLGAAENLDKESKNTGRSESRRNIFGASRNSTHKTFLPASSLQDRQSAGTTKGMLKNLPAERFSYKSSQP